MPRSNIIFFTQIMAEIKFHSFSVIIPALNEEFYIDKCLESLKNQDYKGDFEILVVNNGSTDNTAFIAQKYGVRILDEPQRGISRALRKGCELGKGEIFAFTDADTIVSSGWLSKINQDFCSDQNVVAAGGPFTFYDAPSEIDFIFNKLISPFSTLAFRIFIFSISPALPNANMAIRSDIYKMVGGFNSKMNWGQEIEICKRIRNYGKIIFDSKLKVETSFRRCSLGSNNWIFIFLNTFRLLILGISRHLGIYFKNRFYPAQEPIRLLPKNILGKARQKTYLVRKVIASVFASLF